MKVSDLVSQLEKELDSAKQSSREYLQECIKLSIQIRKLEELLTEEVTVDKTIIQVTKTEQETLHLAMNVLHQQGFINTQGYIKMLEVLKVN